MNAMDSQHPAASNGNFTVLKLEKITRSHQLVEGEGVGVCVCVHSAHCALCTVQRACAQLRRVVFIQIVIFLFRTPPPLILGYSNIRESPIRAGRRLPAAAK